MEREKAIARFFHADPAEACVRLLKRAGVPARISTDSLTADLAALGRGSNEACIVLVPEDMVATARGALMDEARGEVQGGVDASHPFIGWTIEELKEVLQAPLEWSAYDVAVAEKLLRERGAAGVVTPHTAPAPSDEGRPDAGEPGGTPTGEPVVLPGKQPANVWVMAFGFLMSSMFLFGTIFFHIPTVFLGMLVAWGHMFATETPEGGQKRFIYNQAARTTGVVLFLYSFGIFCVMVWRILGERLGV